MTLSLLLLMSSLVVRPALSPPPSPAVVLHVYVHAVPPDQDVDTRGLDESVKDLQAAFRDDKKHFDLVPTSDRADLDVEVLDRSLTTPRVVFGPTMGQPGNPGMVAPTRITHLRVRVTKGADTTDLANKNAPFESQNGWRSAADDVVKQIGKWVQTHGSAARSPRADSNRPSPVQ